MHNSGGPRTNVQYRCLIGIRGNGLDVVVGPGRDYPGRAELVVQGRLGEVGTDQSGRDGNGDPGDLQPDCDVIQEAKPPQLEDGNARGQ